MAAPSDWRPAIEPLKIYEYLTRARVPVLAWVRALDAGAYDREILPGQRSIARTLTHVVASEGMYLNRIEGSPVPPYDQWPLREETPPPLSRLEQLWAEQAVRARRVLGAVRDWATELEYRVADEDGGVIVNASPNDIFTQLVLHEVHHRAQVMVLLRQLGTSLVDIDYNELMYRRHEA
jgi:uncharacterized damage-inducible protein DinB